MLCCNKIWVSLYNGHKLNWLILMVIEMHATNWITSADLAFISLHHHIRLDLVVVVTFQQKELFINIRTVCVIFHSSCECSWELYRKRALLFSVKIKSIADRNWADFFLTILIHISFFTLCQTTWEAFFHIDSHSIILTDKAFYVHTQINQCHMHRH